MALFPDCVSTRAQRHVRELTRVARQSGANAAALLFIVQRGDCSAFSPCGALDPVYAVLLHEAHAAGVLLLAASCALVPPCGAASGGGGSGGQGMGGAATARVEYLGQLPVLLDCGVGGGEHSSDSD